MRAFRLAYDGTPFYGFQRQPAVPTVEDTVFDALRALDVLEAGADRPRGYAAAGRTDAGVSALTQTVAFEAPDWLTPRALNAELPAEIRAWASAEAPADFHATHHATERTYVYHLYAPTNSTDDGFSVEPIDDDRVRTALERLSGTHDLYNLTPDDRNTERTLALEATRDGDFLAIEVRAGGFCRELVRRLVSVVQEVGSGTAELGRIGRVLDPEPLPGHEGVEPAPPEPLVLVDVTYPGLDFEVDEDAAGSARRVFERRRVDHLTGARVAGRIWTGIG